MFLLLGFAFISGLATILAPCIWPLLPVILSSSAGAKGKGRPLGITIGIMLSFALFTLTISSLVKLFHIDANALRTVAVVVIGILGISMIVPSFSALVETGVSRLSSIWGRRGQSSSGGFGSGLLTGFSLGIVWSPCAGPILASIATLASTGQVTGQTVLITFAYVAGVGIPLFIFAYGGQRIITTSRLFTAHTASIQKLFGVIMLLTALSIYTNYDKVLQIKLLNLFPQLISSLTNIDNNPTVRKQLDALKQNNNDPSVTGVPTLIDNQQKAPDFVGISQWFNTEEPLTIAKLKGKVVLVDFWTYTCINCIRTLPHVTSWYNKYKDQGFVVVGIHTPEFEFEKDTNNVKDAINRFAINYPVGQDNDYSTWKNYNNQFWPAEYLIDGKGTIRRTHFGEGEYEETERAIQDLLKEAGQSVNDKVNTLPDETPHTKMSPETYLGAARMEYYYPNGKTSEGSQTFTDSVKPAENSFVFGGAWNIQQDSAVASENATLTYAFYAQKIFLVLRPGTAQNGKVKVFIDGKPIEVTITGTDVKDGVVTVDTERLYHLVTFPNGAESHILKLEFLTPGIEAFAFTFG
jgi:cytochrome c biogenesis protein CcdA/thiol-disulfide isomerase/thioredoxin